MLQLKDRPSNSATVCELFRPRPRPALSLPSSGGNKTIASLVNVQVSTVRSWRAGQHQPQPRHRARVKLVERLLVEAIG